MEMEQDTVPAPVDIQEEATVQIDMEAPLELLLHKLLLLGTA